MEDFNLEELAQKHFNKSFNEAVDDAVKEYLDPKTGMLNKKYKPHLIAYYVTCDMIDIAEHHPNTYDLDIQTLMDKIDTKTKVYFHKRYVPKKEVEELEEELDN